MKYTDKVQQKARPFLYDKDSKSYQAGAWKNLSEGEYKRNQRALSSDRSGRIDVV